MAKGDVYFSSPRATWGRSQDTRSRFAVFIATIANNYWTIPSAVILKFSRWGAVLNCRKYMWTHMGLDPYNPAVIPRSFWQRIRKIWPKKPSDFSPNGYYYTNAESMTRPKWGWSRSMIQDGKPWKMIFRVTAVTETYVYYQGLMWNPPISRKKVPRTIFEGEEGH